MRNISNPYPLCFVNPKYAALYFDKLIPMKLDGQWPPQILPDFMKDKKGQRNEIYTQLLVIRSDHFDSWGDAGDPLWLLAEAKARGEVEAKFALLLHSVYNIRTYQTIKEVDMEPQSTPNTNLSMTLTGIDVVDIKNASWESILAAREDEVLKKKFRRLRVFLASEIQNVKSMSELEDRIQIAIEDHQIAAKSAGIDMVTGTIASLLESKAIQWGAMGILTGLLSQIPLFSIAGGAATAVEGVREIGKVALQVAKGVHQSRSKEEISSVGYYIGLKDIIKR